MWVAGSASVDESGHHHRDRLRVRAAGCGAV